LLLGINRDARWSKQDKHAMRSADTGLVRSAGW
jgi:hypothetical protein